MVSLLSGVVRMNRGGKGVVRTLLGVVEMKLEGHEWMEYSIKQKL